jgi:murein DD-endopeptidase MepM/ murein hydrolase activator NlpD
MKNLKLFVKIIVASLIMIIIVLMVTLLSTSTTTASGEDSSRQKNMNLTSENYELRNNYNKLQKRMAIIDTQLVNISRYNKYIYSEIFGVNTDTLDIKVPESDSLNFQSDNAYTIFTNLDERNLQTSELALIELNKFMKTYELVKKNKYIFNSYPNISPIKIIDFSNISSDFGYRKNPFADTIVFHDGVDITVSPETKVYSTIEGKVNKITFSDSGYGNVISIINLYGFETLYAHLSQIKIKENQYIKKGQLIATSGNSGSSTGPHLHYEIRQNGQLKNPLVYFYTYLTTNLLAKK